MDKEQKDEIVKIILYLIAAGAFVGLAILAPNAVGSLVKEFQKWRRNNIRKVKRPFYYLKQRKLINISQNGNKTIIDLTERGKQRVLKYKLDEMKIKKPPRWDKKWRLVIFDIPTKKKLARDILRSRLKNLGFYKLQKSVFIHPYPCKDEIDFLAEVYEIRPYVKFLLVDSLGDDEDKELLLNYFRLDE